MRSSVIILLVLSVLTTSILAGTQKQCRALVLSAGGDMGSFEAGAVSAIVNIVNAQEVEYDVLTGNQNISSQKIYLIPLIFLENLSP